MTLTATIDQLRPGSEYPDGNINARTYKHDDIESRADSLMIFGQLQSLTVCHAPGKSGAPYYVAAGGLRLAAFDMLVKAGRRPKDHPIEITVRPDFDSAMALAASIEENRERVPLHPVNEYEQFAELITRANVSKAWLPPELRTAHYAGPGGKKSNVAPLRPKAKPAKKVTPKKREA